MPARHAIPQPGASCADCHAQGFCAGRAASPAERQPGDAVPLRRRRLLRHERLYRPGDPFSTLYAVRRGYLKTCAALRPGRAQVVGFFGEGSVLGLDGLQEQGHACEAVALEPSEVCLLPVPFVQGEGLRAQALTPWLHQVLCREVARERGLLLRLGGLDAQERVAAFLLELHAARLPVQETVPEITLSMTREEIGSYLCLTIETVSRVLSRLAAKGWISVCGRHVQLRDVQALTGVLAGGSQLR